MNCECLNMKDKNSRRLICRRCSTTLWDIPLGIGAGSHNNYQKNIPLYFLFFFFNLFICLFIYLFIYFTILYWFCHTSTCIRHRCIRVRHPEPLPLSSPYHPSGSSQCTSPKLPVSCIEPGLAICFLYDIIHVLMPFSQIVPPSLFHRVQKTVLYICVFFAVSHIGLVLASF